MNTKDILIIDDAENNLMLLQDLLTEFNYNIRLARNGEDAIKLVKEKTPDLLLIDIMMPGMDGFELFEKVKKDKPGVKAIFITAKSDTKDRDKAFEMGAVDFITKPVNILKVMDKVKDTLNN